MFKRKSVALLFCHTSYNPVRVCVVLMTYLFLTFRMKGTPWRSWLRHCAANRNVTEFLIDILLPAALWRWG
jgi:hypothetical protein